MSIWDGLEQLGQQPDPVSIAPEQHPVGILGLLAKSAAKPAIPPLLCLTPEREQGQPQGLLGQLMKGD